MASASFAFLIEGTGSDLQEKGSCRRLLMHIAASNDARLHGVGGRRIMSYCTHLYKQVQCTYEGATLIMRNGGQDFIFKMT